MLASRARTLMRPLRWMRASSSSVLARRTAPPNKFDLHVAEPRTVDPLSVAACSEIAQDTRRVRHQRSQVVGDAGRASDSRRFALQGTNRALIVSTRARADTKALWSASQSLCSHVLQLTSSRVHRASFDGARRLARRRNQDTPTGDSSLSSQAKTFATSFARLS